MARLKRHHLAIAALVMSVACLAAGAARATDCAPEHYVWELELDTLEQLAGPGDVQAERAALGETAELRGGHRDDANPSAKAFIDLAGPADDTDIPSWSYGLESEP